MANQLSFYLNEGDNGSFFVIVIGYGMQNDESVTSSYVSTDSFLEISIYFLCFVRLLLNI